MSRFRQPSFCRSTAGHAKPGRMAGGFTLVELLTACVIVSIALLGVYAMFRNFVQVERKIVESWYERQAAEAVVSEICRAVESAVEISPNKAIEIGKEEDEIPFLECLTYGDPPQTLLERRRYRWDTEAGTMDVRTIIYSGSQPVAVSPIQEEAPWAGIESRVIGEGLKSFSIQFKKAVDEKWKSKYSREDLPTMIRVKATIGKTTVERITWCRVTAAMVE